MDIHQSNSHSDTELITMDPEAQPVNTKSRPPDWFIRSVYAYFCCPFIGICAMYYAIRANHAVDWERDPENIRDHTKRAKCLTLTSIILGGVVFVIVIIVSIVMIANATKTVEDFQNQAFQKNKAPFSSNGFNLLTKLPLKNEVLKTWIFRTLTYRTCVCRTMM